VWNGPVMSFASRRCRVSASPRRSDEVTARLTCGRLVELDKPSHWVAVAPQFEQQSVRSFAQCLDVSDLRESSARHRGVNGGFCNCPRFVASLKFFCVHVMPSALECADISCMERKTCASGHTLPPFWGSPWKHNEEKRGGRLTESRRWHEEAPLAAVARGALGPHGRPQKSRRPAVWWHAHRPNLNMCQP